MKKGRRFKYNQIKNETLRLIPQKYKSSDYYEKLYSNKFDNLQETPNFLDTYTLITLSYDEIDTEKTNNESIMDHIKSEITQSPIKEKSQIRCLHC